MKKKYIPDLQKQMASCESNYLRLMKLMPDMDDRDHRCFHILWHDHQAKVDLNVEERFTYTTTVRIEQRYENQSWVEMPALIVRLYHDARMAEVICRQQRRQLQGRYEYPNKQMHHPDEKAQLNQYLGEWLNQCLAHGHSAEALAIA
ncbi:MAG: DUF1249 domain-containing protein [Motiliproteus sp.]|nr:DUF1249 domain-containing protein [Motiliproteus sp.]MCW9051548.1 DUF1249 domain-containing protein [Motiliproteus sp.]